jgi:uroporphyrin-III C-methyltransferase/precorrin-2 dehydrogenase/sirohydrochlorin ferrochelatase
MTQHLVPARARPARLAPLAKLPVFLDLAGKRVVAAGEGAPVVWKAELLAAAGAEVVVYAPRPDPELVALGEAVSEVRLVRRAWRAADLQGAAFAVADIADPEEAERFAAAARERGALVNVIDQPAFCDVQFGAIVNRSPVVIGISTDGAAPILAQAIRRKVEAVLPPALAAWAAAAKSFRGRVAALLPGKAERRQFWERFADAAFAGPRVPGLEELARGLGEAREGRGGEVVLVGAGPGDPELMTLKAVRELQAADVILYDRLVPDGVLELGRREAQRIAVGKEGHGPSCRQDDINALLVSLALQGRRVVRLKGGDPGIFGRTGEEVAACRAAGIPVRIVPGITAGTAAAAALGISLTHRDHAQRVQFVTGHSRAGALPPDIDLDALADPRATTVVYMGRRTAGELARKIVARGLPENTPVLVASNLSRPGETVSVTTAADLARGSPGDDGAPTLVLIGAVLTSVNAPRQGMTSSIQAASAPVSRAASIPPRLALVRPM